MLYLIYVQDKPTAEPCYFADNRTLTEFLLEKIQQIYPAYRRLFNSRQPPYIKELRFSIGLEKSSPLIVYLKLTEEDEIILDGDFKIQTIIPYYQWNNQRKPKDWQDGLLFTSLAPSSQSS